MQTAPCRIMLPSKHPSCVRQDEQCQSALARFLALPEGTACQIITGELVMSPAPIPLHQTVILELSILMALFAKQQNAGRVFVSPIDVRLDNRNIFQPDILFIGTEKLTLVGERMIEGPPDLIVEVLSPSSAYHDLRTKFRVYEQSGVQEYWIVDPERRSVEIFTNSGSKFQLRQEVEGKGTAQSVLLPGLSVDLATIFP